MGGFFFRAAILLRGGGRLQGGEAAGIAGKAERGGCSVRGRGHRFPMTSKTAGAAAPAVLSPSLCHVRAAHGLSLSIAAEPRLLAKQLVRICGIRQIPGARPQLVGQVTHLDVRQREPVKSIDQPRDQSIRPVIVQIPAQILSSLRRQIRRLGPFHLVTPLFRGRPGLTAPFGHIMPQLLDKINCFVKIFTEP